MSKKANHERELIILFDAFAQAGDAEDVTVYLISNSNLPGRRANLELADAFGDVVEEYAAKQEQGLWELCRRVTTISAEKAPANTPEEFLPFCGAIGIGVIGSVSPYRSDAALHSLRGLANDARWRMREAVCFGLQRILAKRSPDTLKALETWVQDENWLEMRAVAAGVAEPALLRDEVNAKSALQLHQTIFGRMLAAQARKSEDFKTLRRALGYTLSVVVQALPTEGFEYMAQLARTRDADVVWVVKQNLKKNRLVKCFPDEVEEMWRLVE